MFVCNWFARLIGCLAGCLVNLISCDISILIQSIITTYHFKWQVSAFKPRFHTRTLVDRLHANIMALVRQDLQTKVTDAFVHLNTRAPIARKETVGKKTFFIWWNTFMKNSTWPFKLSIDESKCQSYSANYSSVCSSRCLKPLLFILLSYPTVWLSGWPSCRVLFLPNSHFFVQINSSHMCWFFSQQ